jgi:hypothetical protein
MVVWLLVVWCDCGGGRVEWVRVLVEVNGSWIWAKIDGSGLWFE